LGVPTPAQTKGESTFHTNMGVNGPLLLVLLLLPCTAGFPVVTSSNPSLSAGMRMNEALHKTELENSEALGFRRASAAVPVPSTSCWHVSRSSLGMGHACPYESDALVHASIEPLFSAQECHDVRTEAATLISAGARSSFTMVDTNRDVAVHDLPKTLSWLNAGAFARIASLAAACFPGAITDPTSLWVYRGLVIQYDASADLTHQPIHRDGSLISCVMPLSDSREYEGGGTFVEPLGSSIRIEKGCALIHPSAIRHAGHRITSGERWVLVLFLNSVNMCYAEHGRRFRARAQEMFEMLQQESDGDEASEEDEVDAVEEEEEEDEEVVAEAEEEEDHELQCLLHGLEVTDESDHEIWYDLGARAHELGDPAEAMRCYLKADALNDRDALLLGNMGVAHLELGEPLLAFRCYRRALGVDPHDVNARFNAGELLLEQDKLLGLAALLADAPEDAMRDEGLQELAQELAGRSSRALR
jgi:predicted 2-oxoglutarate/Fe(II)-dependent dioxygenase YbiX